MNRRQHHDIEIAAMVHNQRIPGREAALHLDPHIKPLQRPRTKAMQPVRPL